MNHSTGRKVVFAKLHTTSHLGNIGEIPTTLRKEGAKFETLEMSLQPNGVYLTLKGVEAFIPLTQIQILQLAPSETVSKN